MAASEVGDEPLMHASDGPAWIARNRLAGALAAAQAGAHVLVMDDGFQNPTLAKDLSILVIDAEAGLGNGRVLPAGPLRESLDAGLARADAAVILSSTKEQRPIPHFLAAFKPPILRARLAPLAPPPPGKLIAFAGIGRPEKFFATLEEAGAELEECALFPDHHPYSQEDLDWLERLSAERGAQLITTEKDFMRLPADWRHKTEMYKVAARFEDEAALDALLAPILLRTNNSHG